MFPSQVLAFAALVCLRGATAQTYSATYLPSNAPDHSEQGQAGTNKCGSGNSQTSQCQNAYINSVDDFCVFAPPNPGPGSVIGNTERIEVAWCTQGGTGTRLIPDGTITGAHFIKTPDFVQVTGVGDLTKINIPAGDQGGELDPHGADGNGNPIGGLVFSNAFGSMQQIHEWTNFVAADEFCFRACKDGPKAPHLCQHIYDVMGCAWNMPGNYDPNVFENCAADSGEPMGIYGTSTFHQGDPVTPPAHPAPASSLCARIATIQNGASAPLPTPSSASSLPSSSPVSTTVSVSATTSGSSAPSSVPPSSVSSRPSGSSPSQTPSQTRTPSGPSAAPGSSSGAPAPGPTSGSPPSHEPFVAALGLALIGSVLAGFVL